MTNAETAEHIEQVRRFNRFYTRQAGLLHEHLVQSPFSLAEARVIYDLAQGEETTATALGAALELDAGYLSRILGRLTREGLVERRPSAQDGRQSLLRLSEAGRAAFAELEAGSRRDVGALLAGLGASEQRRLVAAMGAIEQVLGARPQARPYLLRAPRPGDMGWVVQRHGLRYAEEYGWDASFEALVASIVAEFAQKLDPRREACWIAEIDGEPVGSVFLVRKSDAVAKLRLLLVEPGARGHGIGRRLVDECAHFARLAGYRQITLWTNSVLVAARHIYEAVGFRLVDSAPHRSFGHDLVGETWELDLDQE
jgi:DNA-binding MarR family transcriptional regulator/GNAT superfamily N-acetyltransferase